MTTLRDMWEGGESPHRKNQTMPMTFTEVFGALEEIAAVSSRNAKQSLLAQALEDGVFQAVTYYAYNPFITFGITPSLERQGRKAWGEMDPSVFFALLDQLIRREVTGKAAETLVEGMLAELSAGAGQVLVRILNKDLRAGFTATTINKVKPGAVPEYEPMAAHHYEPKRVKAWPIAAEPKLDGLRVQVWVDYETGEAEARSRNGLLMPALKPLARQLVKTAFLDERVVVFEGEVAAGEFNDTTGKARRKSEVVDNATLLVFDRVTAEEFIRGSKRPLLHRRADLESALPEPIPGPLAVRLMPQPE